MNLRIKNNKIDTYFPKLKVGALLQTLLKNLNLNEKEADDFLRSHELELTDPFTIFGMKEAVEIVESAIKHKKKIAIHGDFDVDGTAASAILWDYLYYERGIEALPIIPHRVDEGYGLSVKTINKALQWGADMIITVDCGIKDAQIVSEFNDQIDFVITDHHQFATDENGNIILPPSKAVVHSAHPESLFPSMISGGATSWQLVKALEIHRTGNQDVKHISEKYLDLVALTTICDIIPLSLENRKLVQRGLAKIMENKRPGLAELMKITNIDPQNINAYHFGFVLGPRLNAPGRVTNDATDSVRILSTRNINQAAELALKLNDLNTRRQSLTSQYLEIAERNLDPAKKAIVVLGNDWPEGILGLIAGKLAEKHYKPTFIASIGEGGQIIGSSRSPLESLYLHKALEYAQIHLSRFGGHKQAAGFASTEELFKGFEECIIEYVAMNTTDQDFVRNMDIDLELPSLNNISVDDIEELSLLEPHGLGNPKPVFLIRSCFIKNYSAIGKEGNHLKLNLLIDGKEIDAIGFNLVDKYRNIVTGSIYDIIGSLSINEWNNRKKIQIEIKEMITTK